MLWDRLKEWLFIDELRFVVAMHFVWNVAIFNTSYCLSIKADKYDVMYIH